MSHFTYFIIGGGMAADAAVQGIREHDASGSIGLASRERDAPYNRPPLSKALWKGEPLESVWRGAATRNATLLLNTRIVRVDAAAKRVADMEGAEHSYEKLLFATGGAPRRLPFDDEDIIYFRTMADYRRLRAAADAYERFAVIGGGFIGSEIAAALAMNGKKVTMLFPEPGIGAHVFPPDMSKFLDEFYRGNGVDVLAGESAAGIGRNGDEFHVHAASGLTITADCVVAGIGIMPETELAETAGVKCDNGILVDESLRTNIQDIYAAGDVANFFVPALERRVRVEHEDNALAMGAAAGRAMAGRPAPFTHIPMFYSDMFDLGYEAAGELDSRLETFADWQESYRQGVIYYLRNGRVRGVLLVNTWGKVDAARALIAEHGPFSAQSLKDRIAA